MLHNCNKYINFVTLFKNSNSYLMESKATNKGEILRITARELFWKHGFRRVSVGEICTKAGVSKMTFYRLYDNKTVLAKDILDRIILESIEKFREIMSNTSSSVSEKMHQIVLQKFEGTKEISKEFIEDLYSDPQSELKDYLLEKTGETWRLLLIEFKTAQQKGWLRSDFKPEFLIALSYKVIEMLNDEKIMSLYNSPQELIMEMTNLIAYGISPR